MRELILVGTGGFAGSVFRYALGGAVQRFYGMPIFPAGTLAVNLLGCLLIGLIAGIAEVSHLISQEGKLLLITGVLGGFTTFSAFGFETVYLLRRGLYAPAGGNVLASVVGGLLAVWLGLRIAELLLR
ncbi:MAG: fluoride efflux transporter CrcB [Oligoflexia bacterium]|nr:fluoride efflux transporter CrcB [Oligoflexia bacterium]